MNDKQRIKDLEHRLDKIRELTEDDNQEEGSYLTTTCPKEWVKDYYIGNYKLTKKGQDETDL